MSAEEKTEDFTYCFSLPEVIQKMQDGDRIL